MSRTLKLVGLGLIVLLILLQFFRPERNSAPPDPELDMLTVVSPPEPIADLIRTACYDCHSNQTVYPWYSRISPVSWYLNKHIVEGKEELNFSDYGQLEKADKIGALADFYDVLDAGTMPLQSYLLIHKQARLSQEDIEALCSWSEKEALKVMRE
ncbi:MAG: heme-binding domain-containing protein [Bacteroidota bacterium]|nr:heme-binding domain-containing protein [Bacteroidota bacterium]